jgi:hypothetical protein
LLAAVGRTLVMEADMGVARGHSDARASVEALLDELLPPEK